MIVYKLRINIKIYFNFSLILVIFFVNLYMGDTNMGDTNNKLVRFLFFKSDEFFADIDCGS